MVRCSAHLHLYSILLLGWSLSTTWALKPGRKLNEVRAKPALVLRSRDGHGKVWAKPASQERKITLLTAGTTNDKFLKKMSAQGAGSTKSDDDNPILECVLSPFVFALSVAIVWLNERRAARMSVLISKGREDVVQISGNEVDVGNRDKLVHCADGNLHGVGTLTSSSWTSNTGSLPSGKIEIENSLKLVCAVQVYQWIETEEKKDDKTTYKYHMAWSDKRHNHKMFVDGKYFVNGKYLVEGKQQDLAEDKYKYCNIFDAGFGPGTETERADRVEYGDGFVLPEEMVDQCNFFVDSSELLGYEKVEKDNVVFKKSSTKELDELQNYAKARDCIENYSQYLPGQMQEDRSKITVPSFHYYWRKGDSNYCGGAEPCVGDYRVAFRHVPDGPATVVALQVKAKESETSGRDTFVPYRVIQRRCCGWTDEDEKAALHLEAKKDNDTLEEQDEVCDGDQKCCFMCNKVNEYCTQNMRPQLFKVFQGEMTVDECFTHFRKSNRVISWAVRLLGWLVMWVSFLMFFAPLMYVLDMIPIIGYFGNMAITYLALFATAVICTLIVTICYLIYHPAVGAMFLCLLVVLISIPFFIDVDVQLHK